MKSANQLQETFERLEEMRRSRQAEYEEDELDRMREIERAEMQRDAMKERCPIYGDVEKMQRKCRHCTVGIC